MLKLIIAVKRHPDFTQEQFRSYLSVEHAKLIRACPASEKYVRRYVQSYTLPMGLDGAEPEARCVFDAVSELWFDSGADMEAFFSDPDYLASVRPDESRFSDRENCVFFVTEERQII
ncbi:EthD domain-containing protein [Paraburkholderia bannensis]|uniref:EthD domain-containing protein n=1 Tax=Paraburkholderia bannensis TaxID=765414 RepID=UPI002AAFE6C3|nr:EthD domain-containing protein [Paraburkholderia bannensis]